MNNLFAIATKELVTDAFFAWLFEEFKVNDGLRAYQNDFLSKLKIDGLVGDVFIEKAERQKNNTDLIVTLKDSHGCKSILFENKIHTTIHSNQLNNYKDKFPNCHKFIYMKLGYIHFSERMKVVANGYDIVGSADIELALRPFKDYNLIISQYYEYIKTCHIDRCENLLERMVNNDSSAYGSIFSQHKFLSDLHEKLYGKLNYLNFKYGANNGGTPWTHLSIAKMDQVYGSHGENIFWRIDKRSGRYYLRLNQYSYVDKNYESEKKERLGELRKLFAETVAGRDIVTSKPSNRGLKESEIGLLFFDKNSYRTLFDSIEAVSLEFVKRYEQLGRCKEKLVSTECPN